VFVLFAKFVSVLLAVIAVSKSYVDFKSRVESLPIFLFWFITWTTIVVVALRPTVVDNLITAYGEGRAGIGTFFGMGLVFLFFIVYRIYVKLERMKQSLTKMVQDLALRDEFPPKSK
jgi:hypothetical protein